MLTTKENARRIIANAYGAEFKFRITRQVQIGVRPNYETTLGRPTLVWVNTNTGVRIGALTPTCGIDWDARYTIPPRT